MPIGTVDYISTAAWNDPYNAWPAYAQLQLSATDIQSGALLTYTLTQFNPNALAGESYMLYSAGTAEGDYVRFNSGIWQIITQEELTYYELPTVVRAIPAGYVQGNHNWEDVDGGDVESLSIIPVTTSLNPWEYRRRRMLEYV